MATTCTRCKRWGEHHGRGEFNPCFECGESGEVDNPSADIVGAYACDLCKGAGDVPKDRFLKRFCNIPLPDIPHCFGVDAKHVRLLAQLPGAQWAPPQRLGEYDCGAVLVRFDQGWGAIMPLREFVIATHHQARHWAGFSHDHTHRVFQKLQPPHS